MARYICDHCGRAPEGEWICPHCDNTGTHIANADEIAWLELESKWAQRIDNHQKRHEKHREVMEQRMISELEVLKKSQMKGE